MKKFTVLLLSFMLAAGTALPVMAAGPVGGTTPAVVAPVGGGLGTRAQASTVTEENQPAPLKAPPVRSRHKGSGKAELKTDMTEQKHWVSRDYKLQPSSTGAAQGGNLSKSLENGPAPVNSPKPFTADNLNLQDQQQDESKQYDTLSKSSSKRHDTVKNSISNVR